MLYRKLIGNFLVITLFGPFILSARKIDNLFNAIFYHRYEYNDYSYTSFTDFLCALYCNIYLIWVVLLLLIFLPFQLIKNYYSHKGKKLSFMKRIGLLTLIVIGLICFIGTFNNIWSTPWYYNFKFIGFALGFSVVFTTLFHLLIDRYEK